MSSGPKVNLMSHISNREIFKRLVFHTQGVLDAFHELYATTDSQEMRTMLEETIAHARTSQKRCIDYLISNEKFLKELSDRLEAQVK